MMQVMVNEEIDPQIVIQRLRREICNLQEEIRHVHSFHIFLVSKST